MARLLRALVTMTAALGITAGVGVSASSASVSCTLYAAPQGSDSANGSQTQPFATVQRMVNALGAGQTGCLRAGTYTQGEITFGHGGTAAAPITLASAPGETATLKGGFVYVPQGSDNVTLENLHIDTAAASQVGVQVMAANTSLVGDDITNENTGHTCVILGSNAGWGQAVNPVISGDDIHQCGSPADGNQDHAIYFDNSTGATVTHNVIWGAAAYAIHLYQNAQNSRVTQNVIADNGYGVIFAGSTTHNSNNNVVSQNIITGDTSGPAVSSYFAGTVGTGNVAADNCVSGAAPAITSGSGFTSVSNVTASPMFTSEALHLYTLLTASPCLPVVGLDVAAALSGRSTSTTTSSTTTTAPPTTASTTTSASTATAPASTTSTTTIPATTTSTTASQTSGSVTATSTATTATAAPARTRTTVTTTSPTQITATGALTKPGTSKSTKPHAAKKRRRSVRHAPKRHARHRHWSRAQHIATGVRPPGHLSSPLGQAAERRPSVRYRVCQPPATRFPITANRP